MKYLILLFLISTVFSEIDDWNPTKFLNETVPFSYENDTIKSVNVKKVVNKKYRINEDYLSDIFSLEIPLGIKKWAKGVKISRKNNEVKFNFNYDPKKGGNATGEFYYLTSQKNSIVFKYGYAEVILAPVRMYRKRLCSGYHWIFQRYYSFVPEIDKKKLATIVLFHMRKAITLKILNQTPSNEKIKQ